MGRRHHFVPRFYLKEFSSAPRRINVFNIRRNIAVPNASLRDQCYAHRLYGPDDVVEDAFAALEGATSRVFSDITARCTLPAPATEEHAVLLNFVAVQLARTVEARAQTERFSKALANAAFDGHGPPPSEFNIEPAEAMRITLAAAPEMARTLADLGLSLVQAAPGSAFLTSDNPAFKYNSYCEGIRHFGVTGTTRRGFQLFLPLSPEFLLHLYDTGVYKVGSRRSAVVVQANLGDISALNRLQFMSAGENVYYRDWDATTECQTVARVIQPFRERDGPRVNRAVDVEDEHSELLHQYWPMPQLGLRLSFLGIQRNARRVPLFGRARLVRGPYKTAPRRGESGGVEHGRFEVRKRF